MKDTEEAKLLVQLGLTGYQAGIVCVLASMPYTDFMSGALGRAAQIPRTSVYGQASLLVDMGLIAESGTHPMSWRGFTWAGTITQLRALAHKRMATEFDIIAELANRKVHGL